MDRLINDYFWFCVAVAINGLVLLVLAMNVSKLRYKHRISLGDGGNKQLMACIRAHSNGIEQVPVFLLSVLALTFLGPESWIMATLVIGFSLSRVSHGWGMCMRVYLARRFGAGFSYLFQLAALVYLLVLLVTG